MPEQRELEDLREIVDEAEGGFYMERRAGPPVRLVVYRLEANRVHIGVPGDFRLDDTVRGYLIARSRGGVWHFAATPEGREGGEKVFDVVPLDVDPGSLRFENTRQFFRFRFEEPAHALLVREADGAPEPVRILDLSAGGVRVETRAPYERGDLTRLRVTLSAEREEIAFDQPCESVVDYGRPGSPVRSERHVYGMRFVPPGEGATASELRRFENLQERVLRLCNALVREKRARGE